VRLPCVLSMAGGGGGMQPPGGIAGVEASGGELQLLYVHDVCTCCSNQFTILYIIIPGTWYISVSWECKGVSNFSGSKITIKS